MKVAVFIPNWIGDAAMCTPALRALSRHVGPRGELIGVLRPYVTDVLAGTPWLTDRVFYHPRSKDRSIRVRSVIQQLRRRNLDAIVLMTNSTRSALIARFCNASVRVGYVYSGRGLLLTHKLYPPRAGWRRLPTPAIDSYLQLAYALGCEWEPPKLELATLPADEAAADAVWNKLKLPSENQVVVFNTGAAYGAAKQWPADKAAALARRIASQREMAVLVNCGPSEREAARQVVQLAAHPRVVSLADCPVSIGLTKAVIRRSRLLVSTDSGPRFFAVAFGVPLVSLFGPTDMRWSRTHYAGEDCLQHEVPCGPCSKRVCPLGHHDCMQKLQIDCVYEAVCNQLSQRYAQRAA